MIRDPYPYYTDLREKAPVFHVEPMGAWVLTRFEDVSFALKHPEIFSSDAMQEFLGGGLAPSQPDLAGVSTLMKGRALISADPPRHTWLRGLVNRGSTPRRIQALEPRIREIARECLDGMEDASEADLMQAIAIPLPVRVIAELLGVPGDRLGEFKVWSDAIVQGATGVHRGQPPEAVLGAMLQFVQYLQQLVEERRTSPADDLISVMIREEEGGSLLSEDLILFCIVLLVAGNETTTNLLGNTIETLLRHPDELRAVAADASLIPGLVEESLRYQAPIQMLPRRTTREVEIAGTRLPAGATALAVFASASRDSRQFPDGDRFVLRRNPQGHLAFGFGIHYCLGASLARLEGRVALEELLGRLRNLRRAQERGTSFPAASTSRWTWLRWREKWTTRKSPRSQARSRDERNTCTKRRRRSEGTPLRTRSVTCAGPRIEAGTPQDAFRAPVAPGSRGLGWGGGLAGGGEAG